VIWPRWAQRSRGFGKWGRLGRGAVEKILFALAPLALGRGVGGVGNIKQWKRVDVRQRAFLRHCPFVKNCLEVWNNGELFLPQKVLCRKMPRCRRVGKKSVLKIFKEFFANPRSVNSFPTLRGKRLRKPLRFFHYKKFSSKPFSNVQDEAGAPENEE